MRDETRFGLVLWIFLLMVGTCGGYEQNTLSTGTFFVLIGIELLVIVALLPRQKRR